MSKIKTTTKQKKIPTSFMIKLELNEPYTKLIKMIRTLFIPKGYRLNNTV
jgi:hypothetical protein